MKLIKYLAVIMCASVLLAGSAFAEQAKCCAKAAKADKKCEHKCCVAAAKDGKECEKCGGKDDLKKKDKKDAPKPEETK